MDTEQIVMAFGRGDMTTSGVARSLVGGQPPFPPNPILYSKIKIKGRGMDTLHILMAFGRFVAASYVARLGMEKGRTPFLPPIQVNISNYIIPAAKFTNEKIKGDVMGNRTN